MDDKKTIDANTNTNPYNNIGIINSGKLKRNRITLLLRILTPMNLKFDNPRFCIVICRNTADTKPRLNQNYIVKL